MNPEPVSPTGWRGHGTGPEPAVRDQAQPSPPRLLPISREISGTPSVSMMMPRRLGHTEGQDLRLDERYKPQLCFEFVRLVGSNRTLKDIRSARKCRKRERLGPTIAIDCDHCLQAFRLLRDRQAHALALRGVDDLEKSRRELALNAEGLGGVMVSVTGGPAPVTGACELPNRTFATASAGRCAKSSRSRALEMPFASPSDRLSFTAIVTSAWSLWPTHRAFASTT